MASYPFAFSKPTVTVTSATYALTVADANIRADATTQNISITLPLAANIKGYIFEVKKTNSNANTVTLVCTGSNTIDGATTKAIPSLNDTVRFQSNGTNWDVLSSTTASSDTASRHSIRPSMLFDFANSGVCDPRLNVVRNSSGSYVSKSGRLKFASANKARVSYNGATAMPRGFLSEEQSTNLLTYSELFDNSYWTKWTVFLNPNSEVAPDGTFTATRVCDDSTTASIHYMYIPRTGSNETLTLSVFVKAEQKKTIRLQLSNFVNASAFVRFDLVNGVVLSSAVDNEDYINTTGKIEPHANGWWRCSLTTTKGSVNTNNYPSLHLEGSAGQYTYDGVLGVGLYIWGAQLEAKPYASSYIPSVQTFSARSSTGTYVGSNGVLTTAASGIARVNYLPTDLTIPAQLLVENAATNLITYSEQFENVVWAKSGTSITANSVTAPDNSNTADKVVESNSNMEHLVQYQFTAPSAMTRMSFSCFVKAGERSIARLGFSGGGIGDCGVVVNLISGNVISTFGNPNAYSVQPYINGWFRISCTKVIITTSACGARVNVGETGTYQGDGTSGIYVWGAQLETGATSSYIPTTNATVTRAADTFTSATATRAADVTTYSVYGQDWFNPNEGTLYCESEQYVTGLPLKQCIAVELGNGTNGNLVQIGTQYNTTNNHILVQDSLEYPLIHTVSSGITSNIKRAVGYASGNHAGVIEGNALVKSTNVNMPYVTKISVGCRPNGAGQLNGYVAKVAYYPKRLQDAELITLTTT